MYTYYALIVRVVDGDTVDAEVDLGFSLKYKARFRIKELDTPETWRPKSDAERAHGKAATAFATELLLDKNVILKTEPVVGIYGRYMASIVLSDGNDFAEVMISAGLQKRDNY